MKDMHIGKLIELRIEQIGMTKAEFARRINRSPQNVQDLLTRTSVDTSLLLAIGKALGYNFFRAFINYTEVISDLKKKGMNAPSGKNSIEDLEKTLAHITKEQDKLKAELKKMKKK